ncbi:sugar ABC transporter permease [Marispirochaeta sp.]|jgi:multiple sugar transport system permease protein|uniref:carbohydrate ABC transporter permease n=1 Tax=Marispirochaeta sp. TaxID=2038653 RepID=UPI0029C96242|nr:sugar ABC transporter permease [Marispirochaeta sp.]
MRKITVREKKDATAALFFLLPNLIGFLMFMVGPALASFFISFSNWTLLGPPTYAGFQNYIDMVHDPVFWKTLGNTAYYVFIKVPINIVLSLVLATMLNRRIRGRNILRTLFFLPMVASSVSVALIWQPLFDPTVGYVNKIISYAGLGPYPWILSPIWAMPSVMLVAIWKELGYYMVIFLAGLQGIPSTYYEAARIDGANGFHEFIHITVPLVSPTTFFVMVISIIGSFQIFDLTTVLTQGGPANATNTLVMYIYQAGFKFFRMGYASSIAYVLFAVVLIFTLLQNRLSKKWVHY